MALTKQQLSRLIEIFYGLAIAEGLARVIPILLDLFSARTLAFASAALLIGIVDWLAYHLFISSAAYRGLTRLLLDLAFPILVFLLFAAAGRPIIEAACTSVYFAFALAYYYLMVREHVPFPAWIIPLLVFCVLTNFTGLGLELARPGHLTHITQWIPFATVFLAAILVLRSVHLELREGDASIVSGQLAREARVASNASAGAVHRPGCLAALVCAMGLFFLVIARPVRSVLERRDSEV